MSDLSVFNFGESDYPPRLKDLQRPPKSLFVKGVLPLALLQSVRGDSASRKENAPVIAIVGARRSSQVGRNIASELARDLAQAGAVIVSGGALGIDAAAHEGALLADGKTIAVLPSSIYRPLPRTNAALFEKILRGNGAYLSEYEKVQRGKQAFCLRNRLIAAFSDLVIVVEAGFRSGTLHTVRAAKKLHRHICAVPWSISDPRGYGSLQIFRDGGQVIATAKDVYRILGCDFPHKLPRIIDSGTSDPSGISKEIVKAINPDEAISIEELCARTRLPLCGVSAALIQLELSGKLVTTRNGRYALAPMF